ncbi:hypothetical protein HMP0015_1935 [Acinetobacter haemolyticus ATCC 19194]|uniref:Uncharacterized protein n=1 Tax=Acinetobacter haemolyticus ATCC 19194 TaxID=707232 RepID=D4XQE3_ACIHA|nr:hypothetical protein HMP0015_1935 [Acinetobacter haemolyticus ATCC 19194]
MSYNIKTLTKNAKSLELNLKNQKTDQTNLSKKTKESTMSKFLKRY